MKLSALFLSAFFFFAPRALAESQESEYKGITDPFGDPTTYEFAEDEKEDKEFFHLGRYMMLGVDVGVGVYTGGLGASVSPNVYTGLKLLYFLDKSIGIEMAFHYSQANRRLNPTPSQLLETDVRLMPVTVGFRYYFDTKATPRAISIANPYLTLGGGAYIRQQFVLQDPSHRLGATPETGPNFGGYGGAGVEFDIYRRHIYLGLDLRYHWIFFGDEAQDIWNAGDCSGDYFTTIISLTYNF